jgi:multidrug resistance efflux pump
MIAMLSALYGGLIYLIFFKLKLVKPSAKSYTIAVLIGVIIIGWILLAMNLYQPYSTQAVVTQYVVQIAPQVGGEVIEVAATTNTPVEKGDLMFRINPEPYQATVDQLEASLVAAEQGALALEDDLIQARAGVANAEATLVSAQQQVTSLDASLDAAVAAVAQTEAQVSLGKLEYERVADAQEQDPGAVSATIVDSARQNYLALEQALQQAIAQQVSAQAAVDSVVDGENTIVAQAEAQLRQARATESKARLALESVIDGENTSVAQIRAQLRQARLNLSWATVTAPADGFVTNLQLREGSVVRAGAAVMSFVDTTERYLIVPLAQNVVRHVAPGNEVEVALRLYPGRIFNGSVQSVALASGEGQGSPSGSLPSVQMVRPGTMFSVRVLLEDFPAELELPIGAGGAAAVFSEGGKPLRIIRKVIIRMYTWLNYF